MNSHSTVKSNVKQVSAEAAPVVSDASEKDALSHVGLRSDNRRAIGLSTACR